MEFSNCFVMISKSFSSSSIFRFAINDCCNSSKLMFSSLDSESDEESSTFRVEITRGLSFINSTEADGEKSSLSVP